MGSRNVFSSVLAITIIGSGLSGTRVPSLPTYVIRHPQPEGRALAARFDWALGEAGKKSFKDGFWVGYSIRRLMGERSWIGSFSCDRREQDISIREIITGQKSEFPRLSDEARLRQAARDDQKKVWKEVAILLRYSSAGEGAGKAGPSTAGPGVAGLRQIGTLGDVEMSNTALSFDFEDLPLVWIGGASDEESLSAIKGLFVQACRDRAKKGLVAAAGVHGNPALIVPFLEQVLLSSESDAIRKDAAFWIGQQDDEKALKVLLRAARSDRSEAVRKNAVFAVSQVKQAAAVDSLIDLAKTADSVPVRKEAVFWLGQIASKKAANALEGFAYDDADTKIQEQALFALFELPGREGLAPLIKIAKTHLNPAIRKRAVFWLGECDDPRALNALIEIAKGKQ